MGEIILDDVIELVEDVTFQPETNPAEKGGSGIFQSIHVAARNSEHAVRADEPVRVYLCVATDMDMKLLIVRPQPQAVCPTCLQRKPLFFRSGRRAAEQMLRERRPLCLDKSRP